MFSDSAQMSTVSNNGWRPCVQSQSSQRPAGRLQHNLTFYIVFVTRKRASEIERDRARERERQRATVKRKTSQEKDAQRDVDALIAFYVPYCIFMYRLHIFTHILALHMHAQTYAYACAYTCIRHYKNTHIYVHPSIFTYTFTRTPAHMNVHALARTHAHTCTHMHTHTHTHHTHAEYGGSLETTMSTWSKRYIA